MSLVRLLGFTTLGCGCVVGRYRETCGTAGRTPRDVSAMVAQAHRRNCAGGQRPPPRDRTGALDPPAHRHIQDLQAGIRFPAASVGPARAARRPAPSRIDAPRVVAALDAAFASRRSSIRTFFSSHTRWRSPWQLRSATGGRTDSVEAPRAAEPCRSRRIDGGDPKRSAASRTGA